MTQDHHNEKIISELRSQKNILKHIVNLLPCRVFWKDKNLCYLGCNQLFAKDAGKDSPEEMIGKDDYSMGWKDQADLYRADDMAVISNREERCNIEEPQTTPDGKTIWLLTNKVPLTNEQNEIIGVLGMYMDITEKKEAEFKMQKLVNNLKSFKDLVIGREHRMIELKKEINKLSLELGRKEPY